MNRNTEENELNEEMENEELTETSEELSDIMNSLIATDDIEQVKSELCSSGWANSLISDLKKLKELTEGKTVFYMNYENFCNRYNAGKQFASTGGSVRAKIGKMFKLSNDDAKQIVGYSNNKRAENETHYTGKLVIDYMQLEI